jgi:enoyl-CoA hydratase
MGASYGLAVGASRLAGVVGGPAAKELLFTAKTLDAAEALRIGLANRVVAPESLESEVLAMAEAIAQNSLPALIASKEIVDAATLSMDAARLEMQANAELRETAEHKERFRAAAERVVRPE